MQNWSNIISYIKVNTGVPYNMLELSDDDIINYLKEHTLPKFSEYIPNPVWAILSSHHQISNSFTKHQYSYELPSDLENYDVIGVQEVYYKTSSSYETMSAISFTDPLSTVIENGYFSLTEDLMPINAFRYIPPKIITFSKEVISSNSYGVVVEVNTVHKRLDTIPSDTYQKIFKDMCLMEILNWLINIRSKYSSISTPFNNINLNIDRLQSTVNLLDAKINDYIVNLPPKILLDWL